MVINLWASYCRPVARRCRSSRTSTSGTATRSRSSGIDYQDTQAGQARKLADETGVTYRLLADLGGDLNGADPLPNFMGLPFQVLVDDDGDVAYMDYGEVRLRRRARGPGVEAPRGRPVSERPSAPSRRADRSCPWLHDVRDGARTITGEELTRFLPPEDAEARRARC